MVSDDNATKVPDPDPSAQISTEENYDPVEEASRESFPASDSPAWNAGRERTKREKRGQTA